MDSYRFTTYFYCCASLLWGNLYSLRKGMPFRCVVYGCSNTTGLHKIPYYEDLRQEAVKRRKRWVDFVKQKRAKWEPSAKSMVCSKYFIADDFSRTVNLPGLQERTFDRLKTDEFGITAYPSIHTVVEKKEVLSTRAARAIRRKVSVRVHSIPVSVFV